MPAGVVLMALVRLVLFKILCLHGIDWRMHDSLRCHRQLVSQRQLTRSFRHLCSVPSCSRRFHQEFLQPELQRGWDMLLIGVPSYVRRLCPVSA